MKPILFPDPIRTKEDYEAIKNQLIVPYSVLIENTLELISVTLYEKKRVVNVLNINQTIPILLKRRIALKTTTLSIFYPTIT